MSWVSINDEEWRELFDEKSELFKIYCGLKRVMDYDTCIAGLSYRISDSFFSDLMYVDSVPGRSAEKMTKSAIRNALIRLEKIGLIKRRKDLGRNVFKLVLATAHESVQKSRVRAATQTATQTAAQTATQINQVNIQSNQDTYSAPNTEQRPEQRPEQGTPCQPSSDTPLTSYISKDISPVDNSLIPIDFKPAKEILDRAHMSGVPKEIVNDDQLVKFIAHHQSKATLSANWGSEYLKWLMNAKVFHQTNAHKPAQKNKESFTAMVERMAVELGKPARPGEDYKDWHQRLLSYQN